MLDMEAVEREVFRVTLCILSENRAWKTREPSCCSRSVGHDRQQTPSARAQDTGCPVRLHDLDSALWLELGLFVAQVPQYLGNSPVVNRAERICLWLGEVTTNLGLDFGTCHGHCARFGHYGD